MIEKVKLIIATAGGLGLSPYFPGSCGALLGVCIHLVIVYFTAPQFHKILLIIAFVLVGLAHYCLNSWAENYWQEEDPKHFVLDEVAGYLIVPILFTKWQAWQIALWGFLLFRIIDIAKIPPARQVDRQMKNATGVILDDVISALYAVIIMYIVHYYF